MGRRKHVQYLVMIWLIVFKNILSNAPCARFHFPTLNGSVVTAREHSTVTLPFEIVNTRCGVNARFLLHVTKIGDLGKYQCYMIHEKGRCVPPVRRSKCTCSSQTGNYEFRHTVGRSDGLPTYWLWSADEDAVQQKNISFNVLYSATIVTLSMTCQDHEISSPVEENSEVEILCVWLNGNPPVSARLLNRHGVEMEGSIYSSGQISYTFPAVTCQDAGIIRCEAPGASHNRTVPLLVKCRPSLLFMEVRQNQRENSLLKLSVRAHTPSIENCRLRAVSASDPVSDGVPLNDRTIRCSNVTFLKGSPPDMTAIVLLDILKGKKGQWRLELTNDIGTGYLDLMPETESTILAPASTEYRKGEDLTTASDEFIGGVTTDAAFVTNTPIPKSGEEDSVYSGTSSKDMTQLTYITAIIAVVLVVGIISLAVSITVIYAIKAAKNRVPRVMPVQVEEAEVVHFRGLEDDEISRAGSNPSTNTYEEIPDRPIQPLMEQPPRPPRRHCRPPVADPDDYLHPVPTPADVKTDESSEDPKSRESRQAESENCSGTSNT